MVYKKSWNSFSAIINKADLMNDDRFGKRLKELSKSDTTKSEFLLKSLPLFHLNMVENIKTKDHTYDDTTRKLREYIVPKKSLKLEGIQKNPIVLKSEPVTKRKRYNYCKSKGRLAKGHVEEIVGQK